MQLIPFLGRSQELAALDRRWTSSRAEALIVVGRRRVGKSRLLDHFFNGKRCIYLVGTREAASLHLLDASREILRVLPDASRGDQPFDSWATLLHYVGTAARLERIGLVLDEFALFCDQSPELTSVLQRWWDREGQASQVMLVLASSHVAFMEQQVLGGEALYGRRTGELRLHPFDYLDAARFFPAYSPVDRIRAYGVFGGMAAYLAACDPDRSLAENVVATTLERSAYLRQEPHYLLSQERSVDRPVTYLSVLRAIAEGETQPSRIATASGFKSASDVIRILDRLREFRLVERRTSVADQDVHSRSGIYLVTDPFLAFWFRFVAPSESALERGNVSWVLQHRIQPRLDEFVSRPNGPWEEACRSYLWRTSTNERLDVGFDRLGSWWEGRGDRDSTEVDAIGLDGSRVVLAASCKWRNEYIKIGDLDHLVVAAAKAGATAATRYVLFSRSGFDPALRDVAAQRGVHLVAVEDMFDLELEVGR